MKRKMLQFLTVVLLVSALALGACSSDKYGDARSVINDQVSVTEDYINGLEKATSAEQAAEAINRYTDGMKELAPRLKSLREKYPELAAMSGNAPPPEELQKEIDRLNKVSERIQTATMNMMKYMMDPQVQSAMARMGQELGKAQF